MRTAPGLLAIVGLAGCDLVFPPGRGPTGDDAGPWIATSAGWQHVCAIDGDHALWCWGRNDLYQLGDATRDERTRPVKIGGTARWDSVSAGFAHTCAIDIDGGMSCWGDEVYGELGGGGGTPTPRPAPTPVVDPGPWLEVSAGLQFTCGIKRDGTLWCWGANAAGQLGTGDRMPQAAPTQIAVPGPWLHVAAGGAFTCAINGDTTLWCWGDNQYAQLAHSPDGGTDDPIAVGAPGFTAISAGALHACAISADGMSCWGNNDDGECGDGTTGPFSVPVTVAAAGPWLAVDAGFRHTCAVDTTGALWCWGRQSKGAFADGSDDLSPQPQPLAIDPARTYRGVTTGVEMTCAIDSDGALACAGANGYGQLGDGTGGPRFAPVQVATDATAIAVGGADGGLNSWSCARLADGVSCWGANDYAQHGDGTGVPTRLPSPRDSASITAIEAGGHHGCELRAGDLWCWGWNNYGQLGDGSLNPSPIPTPITVGTTAITDVAAMEHTCAIDDANVLYCWGDNDDGQLGIGTNESQSTPQQISLLATDVAAGTHHTCAITTDGELACWGANAAGELGLADRNPRLLPEVLTGSGAGWTSLDVGGFHGCAIDAGGDMACWGFNIFGEVGDGTSTTPIAPVLLGGVWKHVATGGYHTCAIAQDDALWCWGLNASGEAGTPDHVVINVPTKVGSDRWIAIDAGEAHTCGIQVDGTVWCWGNNLQGEIGDGSAWRPTFAPVARDQ